MSLHGPPTTSVETDGEQPPKRRRLFSATSDLLQQEGAKAGIIAVVSTVVFFGVAVLLVVNSPNWPRVRDQFFNPDDFRESGPDVLRGFWLNLELFAKSMVVIPILALLVAVMRSGGPNWSSTACSETPSSAEGTRASSMVSPIS